MLKEFRADLHLHTCLSPCGDLKMSPRNITTEAERRNIKIIAITDHNSAENVEAVIKAARGRSLIILPGMEICTREEVHVIAIFENISQVMQLQELVHDHLSGENDPEVFGMQVIANENDEVEGFQRKLLIGAVDLSLEEIVGRIHALDGLAIAAHIDRESYSVIGQLGFIPASVQFDAMELSANISDAAAHERFQEYRHCTFIRNSDAHFVEHIGSNTSSYLIEEPSFSEIASALKNERGRCVL